VLAADQEEKSVDTLTIRPRWYCLPMLYVLAMIVLGAVLGFFHHGVFSGVSILIVVWVLALVGTKNRSDPDGCGPESLAAVPFVCAAG
jgi:hypothetical protein